MLDHSALVWTAIGGFIFVAYTLEAITGFGSIVVALSLGALLVPIASLLPVLVPLSVAMSGTMAWRYRALIDRPLLVRVVLPGMLLGTLAGYGLQPLLDAVLMKKIFGLIIIWFATRELWRMRHASPVPARPVWLVRLITVFAGVSHGLFASGGPLLVYAMAGQALDKSRFRATLAMVWFALNTVLSAAYLWDGTLLPALPQVALYLPLLLVGVWLGEKLHHRVSEQQFRAAIFVLLLGTGTLLVLPRPT